MVGKFFRVFSDCIDQLKLPTKVFFFVMIILSVIIFSHLNGLLIQTFSLESFPLHTVWYTLHHKVKDYCRLLTKGHTVNVVRDSTLAWLTFTTVYT